MRSPAQLFILAGILLAGCSTARDVAVTSFRVIDAPANYIRQRLDRNDGRTTTTTTTVTETSDVMVPGRPIEPTPPPTRPRATPGRSASRSRVAPTTTPPPRPTGTLQFPTAKPVPGKPGYVYSIDPKGGIVDVTGYKSGDKARDPYTQKIFIVP